MTEQTPLPVPAMDPPDDATGSVRFFVVVGLLTAVVGVAAGVTIGFRRTPVRCPDGTEFPTGTLDPRCFEHPDAAAGVAVVAISVMLGILVFLAGLVASVVVAGWTSDRATTRAPR